MQNVKVWELAGARAISTGQVGRRGRQTLPKGGLQALGIYHYTCSNPPRVLTTSHGACLRAPSCSNITLGNFTFYDLGTPNSLNFSQANNVGTNCAPYIGWPMSVR